MESETRVYGYVRVSTKDQNLDRQLEAMRLAGVKPEYIRQDKQSGSDFNRIAYQYLKSELRTGDTLVIKELDRLGRNYDGIKKEWRELTEKGVHIKVLDLPLLDTTSYKDGMEKVIGNIIFELLSYIAENERTKIKQRQKEGIAAARMKGKHLGRPKVILPENFSKEYNSWISKEITAVECMRNLNLSKSTFYRLVSHQNTKTAISDNQI